MEYKTAIHIGCEIVIVGGVVYFLNKKLAILENRIETLEKENDALKGVLNNLVYANKPPHPQYRGSVKKSVETKPAQTKEEKNNIDDDLDDLLKDEIELLKEDNECEDGECDLN